MNVANKPAPFNQQAALLQHALVYARRGWSIILVIGMKSTGRWKPFQAQSADDRTLRRFFIPNDITVLAALGGAASGAPATMCRVLNAAAGRATARRHTTAVKGGFNP
jgi:hypothetical protein